MKHPDEPTYVDADAPFSQDERAAAAVVLATARDRAADARLEDRLMSDARAYFDARRAPRAVTTTGGAEVVIASDETVVPLARKRKAWSLAWLAAAAFVGIAVFWSRSHVTGPGPSRGTAASPTIGASVDWDGSGAVSVRGLDVAPAGHHYVLWSEPGETGGRLERLADFREGGYRYARAVSGRGVVVSVEADGASEDAPRTIVVRSRRP
ncbi:MAG: hypothetical protein JST00_37765 [Deltaproteobacteria bacterium]|nr:hypothetical protein [Deltaproteobacteria bacterium]